MRPGEVYTADFQEVGPHPVIVVSRADLNRGGRAVMVACTSARFASRRALPNCVPLAAGSYGFTRDCVAQCEQVLTIDQAEVPVSGPIGVLDDLTFRDVIKALGHVFDSDCEPN